MQDQVAPETAITLHWPGRAPIELSGYAMDVESLVLGEAWLHCCAPDEEPRILSKEGETYYLGPKPRSMRATASWDGALAPRTVLRGMSTLLDAAGYWWETGCFHRAGLWDPKAEQEGAFLVTVEDIPRHNCIDRLAGWSLLRRRPMGDLALFVSARTTASLMKKVVLLGVSVLCTRAAPTTMGLEMAKAHGISLAAYVKPSRFTIFHDPEGRFAGGDMA